MEERTYTFQSAAYGDLEFKNVEFGEGQGALSCGDTKTVLKGRMSLNVVNSAKYGEEIQLQIYGKDVKTVKRNKSEWDRVELFFPREKLSELILSLNRIVAGDL